MANTESSFEKLEYMINFFDPEWVAREIAAKFHPDILEKVLDEIAAENNFKFFQFEIL